MKRKPVVGLSLKNYLNTNQKTADLCTQIKQFCGEEKEVEQFLFPSLGTIQTAQTILQESQIAVGAQNIAPEQSGAFTGEYSIESLLDVGGCYVEIGHNERIHLFNETPHLINQKIRLTLQNQLVPVVCIGEGNVRVKWKEFHNLLAKQLEDFLENVPPQLATNIIFAYEPGWAIGQAEAAEANFVHQAHQEIRQLLAEKYNSQVAEAIRIIYGGSVSSENTSEIMANPAVDGVFVGRFGHNPQNYEKIVSQVKKSRTER